MGVDIVLPQNGRSRGFMGASKFHRKSGLTRETNFLVSHIAGEDVCKFPSLLSLFRSENPWNPSCGHFIELQLVADDVLNTQHWCLLLQFFNEMPSRNRWRLATLSFLRFLMLGMLLVVGDVVHFQDDRVLWGIVLPSYKLLLAKDIPLQNCSWIRVNIFDGGTSSIVQNLMIMHWETLFGISHSDMTR